MVHTTDDLNLQLAGNRFGRDCFVLIIIKTWLYPAILDVSMQLPGRAVHENLCNNGIFIDQQCFSDLEYMSIRSRPFLPWEFAVVIITVVYIPPDANV